MNIGGMRARERERREQKQRESHRFDFRHCLTIGSLVVEMPEGVLSKAIVCVFVSI